MFYLLFLALLLSHALFMYVCMLLCRLAVFAKINVYLWLGKLLRMRVLKNAKYEHYKMKKKMLKKQHTTFPFLCCNHLFDFFLHLYRKIIRLLAKLPFIYIIQTKGAIFWPILSDWLALVRCHILFNIYLK